MLRNHVTGKIGLVGFFVNHAVSLASVSLIGAAYFSAIGRLAFA